jgi:hypothetical protein
LLNDGLAIDFAHRPFTWTSEARGAAGVHVVVVGFSVDGDGGTKCIFDTSTDGTLVETRAQQINPYLVDAPNVLPGSRRSPLVHGLPECSFGSMPYDDGNLLLDDDEATALRADPAVAKFIRPLIDAPSLLDGRERWCIWLVDAKPSEIVGPGVIRTRVAAVRTYRLASKRAETNSLANVPSRFGEIRQPAKALPVSSSPLLSATVRHPHGLFPTRRDSI